VAGLHYYVRPLLVVTLTRLRLVCASSERDAKIGELSGKIENFYETLRDSSRKTQSAQDESEVQSRRIASLEKRLKDAEGSKAGLDRQLGAASRRQEELEVSEAEAVS
jgi:septal ring factor EnvC (AmiA/AmiB activator)